MKTLSILCSQMLIDLFTKTSAVISEAVLHCFGLFKYMHDYKVKWISDIKVHS